MKNPDNKNYPELKHLQQQQLEVEPTTRATRD